MFGWFKKLKPEKSDFQKVYDLLIKDYNKGILISEQQDRINSLINLMRTVGDGNKMRFINELKRSEIFDLQIEVDKLESKMKE